MNRRCGKPNERPDIAHTIPALAKGLPIDMTTPIEVVTPWPAALLSETRVQVETRPVTPLDAPRIVSFKIPTPQVAVRGFTFPEAPSWLKATTSPPAARDDRTEALRRPSSNGSGDPPSGDRQRCTRIAVPRDVIKLEDRLYYLLQPPLETLLDQSQLSLPFDPFPYQLDGISFLYSQHQAVLADEMGLGKTMQSITAIRLLLHAGEIRSILLVCPKPLVSNWLREFRLWAPEIPVCAIAGDQARRRWQWNQGEFPVKIANYELLLRDQDLATGPERHFDLVVLDEAQRIKNRTSTTSKLVSDLPRTRSWALTGTPIENCSDDLVGIFEFLAPGYLTPGMAPQQLRHAAHDYILRRTKDQVLKDLPPKLYRDAVLELTPAQLAAYELAEQQGVIRLTELGSGITIQHVFELVLRLKQICNFDPATGQSSKLERLRADLEEVCASGQKAIVFSQWVGTITQLVDPLRPFGPLQYHGRTPAGQRDAVLQRFREDPDSNVLLMSYGAGSVGLNLQFAQYVFLFDRWWNPAVEDQAINRAHRIGAAGPVTVTRFTTQGTIEQRIEEILQQKRELFASVLDHDAGPRQWGLSHHEIFGLFRLSPPSQRMAA